MTDLRELVERRIDDTARWLKAEAPRVEADQRHLDEDTEARAYWHFGYLMALKDVLATLRTREPTDA